MQYSESPPPFYLSQHIESYWELNCLATGAKEGEWILPDCTFNVLLAEEPFWVKKAWEMHWTKISRGASFLGQISSSMHIKTQGSQKIFGVRFKPFAFAHVIKEPIHLLNDQLVPLGDLFTFGPEQKDLLERFIEEAEEEKRIARLNQIMLYLLQDAQIVDQRLRAQINYILDRKGAIQVKSLFSEFGISKVTLRKHFIEKVGLSPKKVSRIWRMNYFFHLKEKIADERLTSLSLMAGFYDQAHFNREFKSLFGTTPRRFFEQESYLLKASQEINQRRFTNQYDPRQ
ncbi:MAG: helix-turn-helix domain-containing protein [Bacteroidota bacterium]